ncbi:MAG: outer-membrane lipoprotein carrier protein LolA [Kiritimatiellae bacterium]|nr:outer-membrane lipoprotein carrier protein LolA [Kiritimatiellia bacterium]
MLACCAAMLIMASAFMTDVPDLIRGMLVTTNETSGTFVQTKTMPDGRSFVSRGTYRIRPGVDFEWRTVDPFETLFLATQKSYIYTNEDERVERQLKDLRGYAMFADAAKGDFSSFFKAFDALYKEEDGGVFHLLAKPKEARLAKLLSRVEADGTVTNWTLRAQFPDRTVFEIRFTDATCCTTSR